MTIYHCECCNYLSERKGNYLKHLETKKHFILLKDYNAKHSQQPITDVSQSLDLVVKNEVMPPVYDHSDNSLFFDFNDDESSFEFSDNDDLDSDDDATITESDYQCKYCNKSFKFAQGLSKHIKYRCKKNHDEDMKELVRLLNEQNKMLNQKS